MLIKLTENAERNFQLQMNDDQNKPSKIKISCKRVRKDSDWRRRN